MYSIYPGMPASLTTDRSEHFPVFSIVLFLINKTRFKLVFYNRNLKLYMESKTGNPQYL
jgi:hypothetical protein